MDVKFLEHLEVYTELDNAAEKGLLDAQRRRSSAAVTGKGPGGSGGIWRSLRGPCRLLRLCVLGLLTPALLVSVPLYMRYQVLHEQQYPVALSDVRLLDNRVSTTWCQRQVVSGNASFNAYLVPDTPRYQSERERVGMTRHLVLSDDMKEYWGFYLLSGSQVHISACSRWPGAALIAIRGHKHLRDCAYIGDDSSEEADELALLAQERAELEAVNKNLPPHQHHHQHKSHAAPNFEAEGSSTESSPRKTRLGRPKPLRGKSFDDSVKYESYDTTSVSPVASTSSSNLGQTRASTRKTTSSEALDELWTRVSELGPSGKRALRRLALRLDAEAETEKMATPHEVPSSSEEITEVMLLRRLVHELLREGRGRSRILGGYKPADQGELLRRGSRDLSSIWGPNTAETAPPDEDEIKLRGLLVQEVRRRLEEGGSTSVTEEMSRSRGRSRRELGRQLARELSAEPKEDEDAAIEEGLVPDGIADDRGLINGTTDNDRSNDEFWSSISSSEEALMNCEGLILYQPLTARPSCDHPASASISPTDTFSYTVPVNGYYFFVFSSENEIQENLISVGFTLERVVYNVSERMAQCDNATSCAFPLDFFSSEKVVLEVPVAPGKEGPSPGDSADTVSRHWNEEYLVVSQCEPRTSLYLVCVVLVLVFVMMFALQKL